MANSCKPNLFLIAIFFSLFSQIVSAMDANANANASAPLSKLVVKFCNRQNMFATPDICFQVYRSDPRSATVSNDVTLAQIAMDQVIANLDKIATEFSQIQNPGPKLKPVIDSCVDNYRTHVSAFKKYFGLAISRKEVQGDVQLIFWFPEIYHIGGSQSTNTCKEDFAYAVPRNELLAQKSEIALLYANLGTRVLNLVVRKFFPALAVPYADQYE